MWNIQKVVAELGPNSTNLVSRDQANLFDVPVSTAAEIQRAGENALVMFRGGRKRESLDVFEYSPQTSLLLQRQQSTIASVWFAGEVVVVPGYVLEDYGWKISGCQIFPMTTYLPVALQTLLKMIRWNCATECATIYCSCRKHGLEWSPACGQCQGILTQTNECAVEF